MRIGIDTLFESPSFPTGATGYMVNLLRCLADIDHHNEYFVFTSPANRALYKVERDNFHYITCWASNERRALRVATQQLQSPVLARKFGIDVFNSPGNTAPLLLPCPSVLTIKTMHHQHYGSEIGWRRSLFRRTMVYASAQRATLIVANSQSNREDIIKFLNVPSEKVVVIHEAVDQSCFRADLAKGEVGLRLQARGIAEPYLLNVSSLWRYKNQINLVLAYAQLIRQQNITQHLVLVGAGDQPAYAAEVQRTVSELGLQDRVHFPGYVPHSELAFLYSGADAFIYPSLFETFGLTLLEAMACGVPIVCSNRSSLPEIAGDAALLVDPERPEDIARAIWKILADRGVRDTLVEKGFRRVGEFSWTKTAAETLDVYLRAAGIGPADTRQKYRTAFTA